MALVSSYPLFHYGSIPAFDYIKERRCVRLLIGRSLKGNNHESGIAEIEAVKCCRILKFLENASVFLTGN